MKIYPEISIDELLKILGTTIKHDDNNKILAFLGQLSVYTEDSQLNISFNAPSSSGKSYIPIEISNLFPKEDVLKLGYVSPTSFFHSHSELIKETGEYLVDLSSKIIIFMDQPHNALLEHLRPLLSHDEKEIRLQITDKQQSSGLRTKKILLRGYPAVTFCSAGLRFDDQEATRFLLLSPELTQEKIREGVIESLNKSADSVGFFNKVNLNPERIQLQGRIKAIKEANITEIRISDEDKKYIIDKFFGPLQKLKPRHQRDIKRLVSIMKVLALLNLWDRNYKGIFITINRDDIDIAFKLWGVVALAQELSIPPYVYRIYEDIILAAFNEKQSDAIDRSIGLSRQDILKKHYSFYGRALDPLIFRQQFIPMLLQAGLIYELQDPMDKRAKLIYPVDQNNSESEGGVSSAPNENAEILATIQEIWPD